MTDAENLLALNADERLALLTRLRNGVAVQADELRLVIVTVPRRVRRRRSAVERRTTVETVA